MSPTGTSGWRTSNTPKRAMPANWPTIRRGVLARDNHACTAPDEATGLRCGRTATEVHHAVHRDDHRPASLTSLCGWHHNKFTQAEAAAAREIVNARTRAMSTRPAERHPGAYSDE